MKGIRTEMRNEYITLFLQKVNTIWVLHYAIHEGVQKTYPHI